jgi:hypothetical protein
MRYHMHVPEERTTRQVIERYIQEQRKHQVDDA